VVSTQSTTRYVKCIFFFFFFFWHETSHTRWCIHQQKAKKLVLAPKQKKATAIFCRGQGDTQSKADMNELVGGKAVR
jgi:hypothetical protein